MKYLFYFLIAVFPIQISIAQWATGSDIPERVRAGQTASYLKDGEGFLIITSGRNQNEIITTTTQQYQPSTNSWSTLAPHPTPLLGGATAILKDTLYTIGGLTTTPGSPINIVRKYNIEANTWTQATDFPRTIVDAKAVAYQDSLIYVIGGYQHKTYLYNSKYDRWREATPVFPSGNGLNWGGFTLHNNKLIYVCGSDGFLSPNYWNTVKVGTIDPNDRSIITWTDATPFPGETRTFFNAHPWKDGIIMTGGSTDNTFNTFSNETYFYNPDTDVWTQLLSKPTAWLTGNSGSVLIGNSSKLICASGFQTEYLFETEIFSQEGSLGIDDIAENLCDIKNFKIVSGNSLEIIFCVSKPGPIELTVRDIRGRIIKKTGRNISISGSHSFSIKDFDIPNGIYFCTLSQNGSYKTKKMLVSK